MCADTADTGRVEALGRENMRPVTKNIVITSAVYKNNLFSCCAIKHC